MDHGCLDRFKNDTSITIIESTPSENGGFHLSAEGKESLVLRLNRDGTMEPVRISQETQDFSKIKSLTILLQSKNGGELIDCEPRSSG